MQWISMKDRLPDFGDHVLFFVSEKNLVCAGYYLNDNMGIKKSPKFREALDDCWFEDEAVTHWIPVPKLPEEDA